MLLTKSLKPRPCLFQSMSCVSKVVSEAVAGKRFKSKDDSPAPVCNLHKPACDPDKKRAQNTEFQFGHLLVPALDCCLDPCRGEIFPRFDDCYYKESDKNREYQVTWVECPKIQIKPKKICCFEPGRPPVARRKTKPRTACPPDPCALSGGNKCPKVPMPGCPAVKKRVDCKKLVSPSDCKKVKTPYPSFSECSKPKIRPKRSIECECLVIPSTCDVYKTLARYKKIGKKIKPC